MLIQLIIELLVFLLLLYYITIILHLMGLSIFIKKEESITTQAPVADEPKTNEVEKFKISLGLALIPFYYWFKRETTV